MISHRIVAAKMYWATKTVRERASVVLVCGLVLLAAGSATFYMARAKLLSGPEDRLIAHGEILVAAPLAGRVSASRDFMNSLDQWRKFARSTLQSAERGDACQRIRSLDALVSRARAVHSGLQRSLGRLPPLDSGNRADLIYAITGLEVDLRSAERVRHRIPLSVCAQA